MWCGGARVVKAAVGEEDGREEEIKGMEVGRWVVQLDVEVGGTRG